MSDPTRDVKCWGLLRIAALESGADGSAAIRTQILRTCLLGAPAERAAQGEIDPAITMLYW